LEELSNAEDAEHLSALSIGHFILSGVALLGAAPTLFYGVAGAKLMDELGSDMSMAMGDVTGQNSDAILQDLGSLVTALIVSAVVLAVVSAVHLLVVGVMIRKRRWWTFCYLTGWGECLMFPFGTILGIFTILVLSRPSVKRAFGVD